MLFVKYISDVWFDHYEQYQQQYGNDPERLERRMSFEPFKLPKASDYFLPGIESSDRDRRLADTLEDLEIRDMRNGVYIKASSWVDVVRFEAFTLRIQPKLSNVDLMRMILVAGGLDRLGAIVRLAIINLKMTFHCSTSWHYCSLMPVR